jgi:hypothetical protein
MNVTDVTAVAVVTVLFWCQDAYLVLSHFYNYK